MVVVEIETVQRKMREGGRRKERGIEEERKKKMWRREGWC